MVGKYYETLAVDYRPQYASILISFMHNPKYPVNKYTTIIYLSSAGVV